MQTLLLSRSEVQSLLNPVSVAEALREAFIAYSTASAPRALRVRSDLPGPGTATVLFPGTVSGLPAYTVKVHAKFPGQVPAIRGVLCLHSVETGDLLAIMDSTHITAVRTGIVAALASHVLARSDADSVAILGAGVQGRQQLASLATMRAIRRVRVYDTDPSTASQFCADMAQPAMPVEKAGSVREAIREAGIVLAATWSRVPLILPDMLAPGTHITTLGADEPGKIEVAADVIRNSVFFCDDRALAAEMGALAAAGLAPQSIAAELGEVLAGRHAGRTSAGQITVYGAVGLPFQDAVCAWAVYQSAAKAQHSRRFNFLD